ncbi:MAG: DUF5655 domain-containing protein [Bacteroidota bacterium]
MWTCPKCKRKFKSNNQYHICTTKDIGELFLDKSDELVLAFDRVMTEVMVWKPNDLGASIHSVVFTNKKAWLIIKPMKSVLDVKFYYKEIIESDLIAKRTKYPNKFAHHIRVASEEEVTPEIIKLLRMGYEYALT